MVLIVAKCNVNHFFVFLKCKLPIVLIVAKCNVNAYSSNIALSSSFVLIVAKCNVNLQKIIQIVNDCEY